MEVARRQEFWSHLYSRAFRLKRISTADVVASPPSSPHHLGRVAAGDDAPHFHHLKRSLGVVELCLMGVGASIGAGIFVLTGVAAISAGPGVVVSYMFAGAISVLDALCYAELASRWPLSGSVYLYTSLSLGEYPALLVSLNLLFDYHVAAALISRSFAIYLVKLLTSLGLHVPSWVSSYSINHVVSFNFIAPLLLVLLTWVLCRGASHGALLNTVLTVVKVIVVVVVIATGSMHVHAKNWTPFFPTGVGQVLSTSSTVFFSYVGFDTVAASSEEVKNPKRDLPIAILVSLTICSLLYMAVCLVITGMLPYHRIDAAAPLSSAFQDLGLSWIEAVISVGGVVGLATTLLVGLYAQARVYLSIARDGLIPAMLADINPGHKTPVKAQVWCGAIAATMAGFFNVKLLSELLDIGVILAYGTVCASLLVLRSASRTHTVRWLGVLVVSFALPCIVLKLHGGGLLSYLLFLPPLLALIPLVYRQSYQAPTSAFACPLVPAIPLLGVLLNVYLSINLNLYAWLRAIALFVCLSAYYVWSEAKAVDAKLTECMLSGKPASLADITTLSPAILRHRRAGPASGGMLQRPLVHEDEDHSVV